MLYRYLLVREELADNEVYDTLQEAREAQQRIPQSETSGIVRVSLQPPDGLTEADVEISYKGCSQDDFIILTME